MWPSGNGQGAQGFRGAFLVLVVVCDLYNLGDLLCENVFVGVLEGEYDPVTNG